VLNKAREARALPNPLALCRLRDLWNGGVCFLLNIPSTTQRLDQLDARRQLFHLEVQRRPLIVQQRGLRIDHIEVNINAGLLADAGKREITL